MIETFESGATTVTHDRDATRRLYAARPAGNADRCTCISCRNFTLVRDRAYPPHVLALLERLGIDRRKENELECAGGIYTGGFDFVGRLTGEDPAPPFTGDFVYHFVDGAREPLDAASREFERDHHLAHIAYMTEVPWLLPGWNPDHDPISNMPGVQRRNVIQHPNPPQN